MGFRPMDPNSSMVLDSVPIGYNPSDPSTPAGPIPSPHGDNTLDEMPSDFRKHRTMRAVLRNDEDYASYLRANEFEVESIPGVRGVLKVRRSKNEPWRVTDRANPSGGEMLYDLMDVFGDAIVGGFSAAGSVVTGGPTMGVGSLAGAGLGAAVGEGVVQGLGALTGHGQFSGGEIVKAGVLGTAGEGAFKGVANLATKAGSGAAQGAATMAGIKSMADLPPHKVFLRIANEPSPPRTWYGRPKLGQATRGYHESVEPVRAFLAEVKNEGVLPETQAIRQMLQEATDADMKINLGEFYDFIRSHGTQPGKDVTKSARSKIVTETEFNTERQSMRMRRRASTDPETGEIFATEGRFIAEHMIEEGISPELASVLSVPSNLSGISNRTASTLRTVTAEGPRAAASLEATLLSPSERRAADAFIADIEQNVFGPGETWLQMSPNTADHIRKMARNAGRQARAWNTVDERLMPVDTELGRILSQGYHKVRKTIDDVMGDPSRPDADLYNDLRFGQRNKLDALDTLRDHFGRSFQDMATAGRWLYNGPNRQPTQMAISDAARAFGINIEWLERTALQEAATGYPAMGVSGMPFAGIRSPSLQVGMWAGTAFGATKFGVPAAAMLAAGSPQVLLYGARQLSNVARMASAGRGFPLRFAEQTALAANNDLFDGAVTSMSGQLLDGTTADLTPGEFNMSEAKPGVAAQDPPPQRRRANLTSGF